jgi:hypothetical protein
MIIDKIERRKTRVMLCITSTVSNGYYYVELKIVLLIDCIMVLPVKVIQIRL